MFPVVNVNCGAVVGTVLMVLSILLLLLNYYYLVVKEH